MSLLFYFILLLPLLLLPLLSVLPVKFFILPSMRLPPHSRPLFLAQSELLPYRGRAPDAPLILGGRERAVRLQTGALGYLIYLSLLPEEQEKQEEGERREEGEIEKQGEEAVVALGEWYHANNEFFEELMDQYGGVLLRGFPLSSVQHFDHLVGRLHPDMQEREVYVGTGPRKKTAGTSRVSSASEVYRGATIPAHLELPFMLAPPRRVYFFAQQPNPPPGGQTVVTDFRAVWRSLPEALKEDLVSRGMTYRRCYFNAEKGRRLDPLKSKSWQDMFETSDRSVAEAMAAKQNFTVSWNDAGDICLTHEAVVVRRHQNTDDEYWSTHFNVLHGATFAVPSAWNAQLYDSTESALLALGLHAMVMLRQRLGFGYSHDMVHGDGSSITWEEAMTIRETISTHTWIYDHQEGDVLMLDNHRLGHGRSPWFSGKRYVFAALYH